MADDRKHWQKLEESKWTQTPANTPDLNAPALARTFSGWDNFAAWREGRVVCCPFLGANSLRNSLNLG